MTSKDLTAASAQTLAATFDENARLGKSITRFLRGLMKDNPEQFWGLFDGSTVSSEMEDIVHRTVYLMLSTRQPSSHFALTQDLNLRSAEAGEQRALKNLKEGGYVLVNDEGNKITLTNKMLDKLYEYSGKTRRSATVLVAHSTAALLP